MIYLSYKESLTYLCFQYLERFGDKLLPATSPAYNNVLRVARRIVTRNQDFPGMKDHTWTIHVIEDNQKNAFVFPVRTIYHLVVIANILYDKCMYVLPVFM